MLKRMCEALSLSKIMDKALKHYFFVPVFFLTKQYRLFSNYSASYNSITYIISDLIVTRTKVLVICYD
jgi:hypothetical protein